MCAIEINDISKIYEKSLLALDKLSFKVLAKQIFGLVGPNGAGKSTLINLLANILHKNSGSLYIWGIEIKNDSYLYKKETGFLLEESFLFEKLNLFEYLLFVAIMYDIEKTEAMKRINELLNFFQLENDAKRYIETYSAGMKKKVELAAAIIHNPKLLILDEPFESVDPISRKKMKDVLKRMKEKGSTVFITSHALAEVEDFCDEVAIINKGKIVYQSETKDIRNKIKNEVTKETYQSLEEIFIDLTTDKEENDKTLSWI
ncbi:MAG: ABC transporter ATP-binding protein [Bacteroidota bacterium]